MGKGHFMFVFHLLWIRDPFENPWNVEALLARKLRVCVWCGSRIPAHKGHTSGALRYKSVPRRAMVGQPGNMAHLCVMEDLEGHTVVSGAHSEDKGKP